jgi:hypothetical protein
MKSGRKIAADGNARLVVAVAAGIDVARKNRSLWDQRRPGSLYALQGDEVLSTLEQCGLHAFGKTHGISPSQNSQLPLLGVPPLRNVQLNWALDEGRRTGGLSIAETNRCYRLLDRTLDDAARTSAGFLGARLIGLRSPSESFEALAVAPGSCWACRLARNASSRSITWPPLVRACLSATICLPEIFSSTAARIRFFSSSTNSVGS